MVLQISNEQRSHLDQRAAQRFPLELEDYLSIRNPGFLPSFPEIQRQLIVSHMVGRARSFGATLRSTIGLYTDFMQCIAPDFEKHPLISPHLAGAVEHADARLKALVHVVPRSAWDLVASKRIDLFLYTPKQLDHQSLQARLGYAFQIVFWDHVSDPETAHNMADRAISAAPEFGLGKGIDAPLILMAWRLFYGEQHRDERRFPWLRSAMNSRLSPEQRIAMLRTRIAIDHRRRV